MPRKQTTTNYASSPDTYQEQTMNPVIKSTKKSDIDSTIETKPKGP